MIQPILSSVTVPPARAHSERSEEGRARARLAALLDAHHVTRLHTAMHTASHHVGADLAPSLPTLLFPEVGGLGVPPSYGPSVNAKAEGTAHP